MFDLTDATVAYVDALVGLFFVFGVAIILYSLDDVLVDIIYWAMRISGTIRAEQSQLSEQELLERPQRPLAVMVPAWREEDVIYDMLKTNAVHSATTVFFVGAYPNDAATQREVLRAAAELPANVRLVIGPHDGPTTKADCLNALIAEIGKYEKDSNIEFQGFVLHDSEDVIHPLEFPLFSALIATFDFIQIPVYSFRRTLLQMTAGTYMDEFAEFHNKDLFVRQRLTGVIPCAGVAACFSRRAIEALKSWRQGEVFDPVALTEDYDVAFAMKSLGLKSAFILNEAPYTLDIPRGTDQVQRIATPLAIAAREHFPSDYRAAYRQRARWLLGIGFQGASKLGWGNTLTERLFFLRDRKGILSGIIAVVAYFLAFDAVAILLLGTVSEEWRIAGYAMLDPTLRVVFFVNILLLINRLIQRMIFTTSIYGFGQGLMAAPRVVFSNFINFSAALRALYIFVWRHKVRGQPLSWDKTAHTIPAQNMEAVRT
ncbi:phage adsorption protein NrfB [Methylocystis sp. L43]|jgi:adsorption protein B|uniref:glycosyl transferase family protein n=1 Tax=unclassified Methylocystis TaxID=2625913 RepID=UPI0018C28EA0|nr:MULTISPECIES: glycosyl transferase family protein [unclassified Methylocystis]MBG0798651.1 phage adsorption protein NrfB [Methylocystis sp. L43]MBG0806966.1 phage adsorption protein NrfB [Methylocystis sp. H15]